MIHKKIASAQFAEVFFIVCDVFRGVFRYRA